jgi:Domain of unknown function (DUF4432)
VSGLPRFGAPLDRERLRRLVGHTEQVLGAELVRREDGSERGVRVVQLRNGELEVDVVVDRALDIAGARIRGVPVAWLSPTGVAGPWYAEPRGLGTFRTFFGGLLTTCGLDHTLAPADDDVTFFRYPAKSTEQFPLHGRISCVPARLTGYGVDLDATPPCVWVEGEMRQALVFGENLVLRRRIEADVFGRTLRVRDRVRNDGYAATPHAILYHVNAGWPLVAPGCRVVAAVGEPCFATEAARGADWRTVEPPRGGAVEQVWEHRPIAAADGRMHAAVLNEDIGDGRGVGMELTWSAQTLPRLFEWKVMGEGHYVVGLEPGNLPIDGRAAARERGEMVVLEPGGFREYALDIGLLWGAADLGRAAMRASREGRS